MAQNISFQQALALAKSGDAEAQYALGSALHQRGHFEESLHWLGLAAAQNLPPARMALATLLIDGRKIPRDLNRAAELLQPLAATQIQANVLLGELHGFAALEGQDRETGLRYLLAAARMGDAGSMRQLALLAACHRRWDLLRPLLDASARRGDGAAAHTLALCHAGGIGGARDPSRAIAMDGSAASRNKYLASQLGHDPGDPDPTASAATAPMETEIDWLSLEQALPGLAADIPLPVAETLHETTRVRKLAGVFHPLVLDALIHLAAPLVQRSQILDARTGEARVDPTRTCSHVTLGPRKHDHVLEAVERCIGSITGIPVSNGEFLQILRYRPGEEFRPHVDYFNEGGAGAYQSLADGGQRAQTVLLYLNEDYEGGSTCFPKLQLDIKGRRGDILQFHNLDADGLGDRDSLHAGMPVLAGEKWLLSQWIRSEAYPARLAW